MAIVNPAEFLPTPEAILTLNSEVLHEQWVTSVVGMWPDYDLVRHQFDPGVIVARAMAPLRKQDRAIVNDTYRGLRLGLATGNNLIGLAADRGVRQLVYREATADLPEVVEDIESLRLRSWLAMQNWGVGSVLGIEYQARTAALGDISDAHAIDYPGLGYVDLVLLAPPESEVPNDFDFGAVVSRVGSYVMARERRPGAVYINTIAAEVQTVDLNGVIRVRRGASKESNLAAAETQWRLYMKSRRRIGADVPFSAVDDAVITREIVAFDWDDGPADIIIGEKEAAEAGAFNVTAEWTNE